MAKQLNIDLRFNADVSAAKAQLQSLQTSLNQLTTGMATQGTQLSITPQLQQAQQAAVQLKTALSQSMNVETGKFDLSKFNSSLKSMNTDLSKLKTQLVNLGPSGQQTFMTLAQSIMTAEIPTKRISASLAALGTTLKNTAKWQLSSSMLHGFMSAVQSSYRYAQDLNKSLNQIRIVTGESSDAMDKFAARANKAAKSLSASTLDYTKASLILYQQGLQGKDVEERANIMLKMANVTGQTAEVVSDQMTAVWNNFYDGSKSLEYYADVLAALGAATASSTDEIAGGLEKFAAIGETIGLSYEYAASALATITSNTRESEEVVGTALKTIFARMQGLKLGETLEDGVELNKYSEALQAIGVSIFEANGELKAMDNILDETADKWSGLSTKQQTALAQTVAGVRQYNQFVTLMDNWNDGTSDSMVNNLKTASEAMGTLQEQQDTYAESWEAARDRVKAAAEELYMGLLDDDFFIGLTDGFADFLGLLDNFIDAMGGAKGLLSGFASILLYTFSGPAAKALESMVYNFKSFVGLTQKEALATKQQAFNLASSISASTGFNQNTTPTQLATTAGMQNQLQLEQELLNIKDKLTEAEQLQAKYIIEQNNAYSQQAVQIAQQLEVQKEKTRLASQDMREAGLANWDTRTVEEKFNIIKKDIGLNEEIAAELERANQEFLKAPTTGAEQYIKKIEGLITKSRSRGMEETATHLEKKIKVDGGKGAYRTTGGLETQARADKNIVDNIRIKQQQDIENKTRNVFSTGKGQNKEQIVDNRTIEKTTKSMTALVQKEQELDKTNKGLVENTKKSSEAIKNLGNTTRSWSQTMVGAAQGVMSLSFAISSLNSLKTTWADDTIGTGEKLLQTFMSAGMAIPMLINGINGLKTSIMGSNTVQTLAIGLMQTRLALGKENLATLTAEELAKKTGLTTDQAAIALSQMKTTAKLAESGASNTLIASMTAEQVAEALGITTDQAAVVISGAKTGATLAEAAAEAGLTVAKGAGTLATIASTIANWGWLASMSPILAIALVLTAAIAGLALVIWGVVSAVKAAKANSPEEKLKAAKKESEDLTKELNKTKEAAENLKSSFNDYDDVSKKLSECKKGTEEWNEALRDNNDKVRELLKQYPQLSSMTRQTKNEKTGEIETEKAVDIDENGVLTISDWAMEILINEANIQIGKAQLADALGQQNVREQNIKNQKNELQWDKDALNTIVLSASAKTEKELRNKGYDSQILQQSDGTYMGWKTDWVDDAIDSLINKYGEAASQHVSEIDGLNQEQQNALAKVIDSELGLRSAIEANTQATLLENESSVDNIMSGYEGYENSKDQDLLRSVIGQQGFDISDGLTTTSDVFKFDRGKKLEDGSRFFKDKAELTEAYMEALNDRAGLTKGMSDRSKDAFDDYLTSIGLDPDKLISVTRSETGFEYQMEGQEGTQKVTKESVANRLTSDVIGDKARNFGEKMTNQMESFESREQKEIFAAGVTGDGSLLSEELIKKGQKALDEYIDSMEIGQDVLKELGGISEEAFKSQLKDLTKAKKAFDDFAKSYEGNMDKMAAGGDDATEAAQNMADDLEKVFNTKFDLDNIITPEFVSNNQQLFDDFVNGVEGSADRMRLAIGKEIWIKAGLDSTDFDTAFNDLNSKIMEVNGVGLLDLEIGASLNDQPILDSLTNIMNQLIAAGYTAQEANAMIVDSLGIDVEFVEDTENVIDQQKYVDAIPVEKTITGQYIHPVSGELQDITYSGVEYKLQPSTMESEKKQTAFGIKATGAKKVSGGNINKRSTGGKSTGGSKTSGGGGGGGGGGGSGDKKGSGGGSSKSSEPGKKSRLTKKSEIVERYKEISDNLKQIQDIISDTSLEMDKLWGKNRLKAMEKYRQALREQVKIQEQYKQEIEDNLAVDKQAIIDFMKEAADGEIGGLGDLGLSFTFDSETGNITNYTEIMTQLHTKLNELEAEKNALSTADAQSDFDEKTLAPFQDKIDWLKDLISQYDDTNDQLMEKENELQDILNQIRENVIEDIKYKVELSIEFNDQALEYLEYKLGKVEDDFYKIAEASELTASKITNSIDSFESAYKPYNDLLWEYNNGNNGILFDDVAQAAMDAIPDMVSALNDIQSLDRDMLEYYASALDMAQEKFDKYNQFIDNAADKMEHYKSMLSLIGKEMDYDKMGLILQGQYDIASNSVRANKAYYEEMQGEYTALYNRWLKEKDTLDGYEKEMLERKLYDAKVAVTEAEEEYLSSLETTGELAQEILQNNLEQARKTLEQNLVGSSLEDYLNELDKLNKKQEEYLTTTNKLYETNKLIRQAQLDIDKTDNQRAKQQYNDYVKYIEQLQRSGDLSVYELSIAQARYQVLQAQIALEEAQDAKNQVRLTRDAEGNYGYVYTANEDKVSNAEQALADAENALYNIGLDGAKDYQSKYAETMQEAVETFAAINEEYQTGQIASEEEYNRKMTEAKEYYYGLLKQYNELYYVGHDLLVEESYLNEEDYLFQGIGNLEDFAYYTDEYLYSANEAFDGYNDNVADITTIVDKNLDTLEDGTNDVVIESENLADTIETKLIPALDEELLAVREVTSIYAAQRVELQKTIEEYEKLIEALQTVSKYGITGEHDFSNIKDFSLEIEKWLNMGYEVNDPIIQELLEARWQKMGGKDEYNYAALMEEELEKNGESVWYNTLKAMRDYKIFKTDWSAYQQENPEATWVEDVRKEKLSADFAAEIKDYLQRPGTSVEDAYVQDRLALRSVKIAEYGLTDAISNEDLINEILKKKPKPKTEVSVVGDTNSASSSTDTESSKKDVPTGALYVSEDMVNYGQAKWPAGVSSYQYVYAGNTIRYKASEGLTLPQNDKYYSVVPTDDSGFLKAGNYVADAKTGELYYVISANSMGINNETSAIVIPASLLSWDTEDPNVSITDQAYFTEMDMYNQLDWRKAYASLNGIDDPLFGSYQSVQYGTDKETGRVTTAPLVNLPFFRANNVTNKTGQYTIYIDEQSKQFKIVPSEIGPYEGKDSAVAIDLNTGEYNYIGRDYTLTYKKLPAETLAEIQKFAQLYGWWSPEGFDTGGYTGNWGPEGKLAVLHEKELVLNKEDTANFLTATNMLREISQMLDNNALVASLGAINLHAMTIGTPADQVLQQEVTIHADFPNVTDHNEIEIAIDNLINAASQHAYKA